MPTGYTYKVAEGEITTVKDYALECASAFLPSMRDKNIGAAIPMEIPIEPYYFDRVVEINKQMQEIYNSDCIVEAAEDFSTQYVAWKKASEEHDATAIRYNTMLQQVQDWTCSVEGLKEFMLSQLSLAIKHDCGPFYWGMPVACTVEEWKRKKLSGLFDQLAYCVEEATKVLKGNEENNKWLRDLRACIE